MGPKKKHSSTEWEVGVRVRMPSRAISLSRVVSVWGEDVRKGDGNVHSQRCAPPLLLGSQPVQRVHTVACGMGRAVRHGEVRRGCDESHPAWGASQRGALQSSFAAETWIVIEIPHGGGRFLSQSNRLHNTLYDMTSPYSWQ